jgi:hypothetical protein
MKKLELKHLASYLPYGLKFKDSYADDVSIYTLSSNQLSHWESGHIKPFLPILRPLSQLTQEIEHNGERFVPMDLLAEDSCFYFDNKFVLAQPYWVIEKLLEWHFDIYGLIDNNLAIQKP